MKRYFTVFAMLTITFNATSQKKADYIGSWEGVLSVGQDLTLVFNITQNRYGNLSATADSPDQAVFGIPCDTVIFLDGGITIEVNAVGASFKGKLDGNAVIKGKFSQGAEFPLELKKVKDSDRNNIEEAPRSDLEIEIDAPNAKLSGSFLNPSPDNKKQAVLIIAGSGPTDRNGNSTAIPGKNNSLQQLADSLFTNGIASLRYDKRGIGKSKVVGGMKEEEISIDDMVDDAGLWYDWLKKQGFKSVFVAGLSEGSLISLLVAQKKKPAGVISIAGAGRLAVDILSEQLAPQISPDELQTFKVASDSIIAGHTVKNIPPNLQSLLRPSIQPYLRSWFKQDPKKIISKLKSPVLIVQGEKDIQVSIKDANSLKEGKQSAKLVLLKNMNHVMKDIDSDDRAANINAYSDPSLPLSKDLVTAIVSFIRNPGK